MRFFLDQDVDARVGVFIRQRGHDSWTAADAGLSADRDDELSAYADDHGAVIVSHDRAFAQRRQHNTIGQHLWLRCDEPDAVAVLTLHWDEIIEILDARADVVVKVTVSKVTAHTHWD